MKRFALSKPTPPCIGIFVACFLAASLLTAANPALAQSSTGQVGFARIYDLHVGVSGEVADVSVSPGDRVKAGTLLLSLTDSSLKSALAAATANREWKQALADEAERSWERDNELYAEGSLSQVELDLRDIARLQAIAELKQSAAAVALAESRLNRSRILAPASGVVLAVNTHGGDRINLETNPGPLLVMGSTELVVRAIEQDRANLPTVGQRVTLLGAEEIGASVVSVLPAADGEGMVITAAPEGGLLPPVGTAVEIRY